MLPETDVQVMVAFELLIPPKVNGDNVNKEHVDERVNKLLSTTDDLIAGAEIDKPPPMDFDINMATIFVDSCTPVSAYVLNNWL